MKNFLKKMFYSKTFKKGMIAMLYANPRLTGAEYKELNEIIKAIDETETKEIQMELKKAS